MGLPASGEQRLRAGAQPWRLLRLVQPAPSASGTRVANTGRGLLRQACASRGSGGVTRCPETPWICGHSPSLVRTEKRRHPKPNLVDLSVALRPTMTRRATVRAEALAASAEHGQKRHGEGAD